MHIHLHIDKDTTDERFNQILSLLNTDAEPKQPKQPPRADVGEWVSLYRETQGKQIRFPQGTPYEERERIAKERCMALGITLAAPDTSDSVETADNVEEQY